MLSSFIRFPTSRTFSVLVSSAGCLHWPCPSLLVFTSCVDWRFVKPCSTRMKRLLKVMPRLLSSKYWKDDKKEDICLIQESIGKRRVFISNYCKMLWMPLSLLLVSTLLVSMKASLVLLGKSLQILPWLYNLPNLSLLVWLPLGWPSLPSGKRLLPSKSSHYRQFQYLLLLLHPTCIILVLYILYTFSLKNGTIVYKHHHTCFPIDARALLFHHAKDAIRSSFVIYFRDHVTQWHRVHFLSRSIPTAFWTYIDIGEEWSDWLEGVKRGSNNNIEEKGLKNAFFIL